MGHINYDKVMSDGVFNSNAYMLAHTVIPEDPSDTPNIIGVTAPARSGTTAFLLMMASQSWIDRAYFQPQKTLLRNGKPDYILSAKDKTIFTKETLGVIYPEEDFDPVAHLLARGVPANKITWITLIREPVHTFASWRYHVDEAKLDKFVETLRYTIYLYHLHKDEVRSIPVAYELFAEDPERVLKAIFNHTPYADMKLDLNFNDDAIAAKTAFGQASNPDYYRQMIQPVQDKRSFKYVPRRRDIAESEHEVIMQKCGEDYEAFVSLSRQSLGL